jgi:flagellar L-ring protein precursor FlgH
MNFNLLIVAITFCLTGIALPVNADSLFDQASFRSAAADRKAYQVGDALTILIMENTSAQTSAQTITTKSGGPSLKLSLPSVNAIGLKETNKSASIGMQEDFSGKGNIARSGKLLGTITVIVQSVEANGDLNVKGEQLIEINEDKQAIKLEGRVRMADIVENNTIESTRIANAKISYIGDGVLASRQHPGILSIVLSLLGLL